MPRNKEEIENDLSQVEHELNEFTPFDDEDNGFNVLCNRKFELDVELKELEKCS